MAPESHLAEIDFHAAGLQLASRQALLLLLLSWFANQFIHNSSRTG